MSDDGLLLADDGEIIPIDEVAKKLEEIVELGHSVTILSDKLNSDLHNHYADVWRSWGYSVDDRPYSGPQETIDLLGKLIEAGSDILWMARNMKKMLTGGKP